MSSAFWEACVCWGGGGDEKCVPTSDGSSLHIINLEDRNGPDDEIRQDHSETVMSNCDIYFQL
jgi:hypothetical protein